MDQNNILNKNIDAYKLAGIVSRWFTFIFTLFFVGYLWVIYPDDSLMPFQSLGGGFSIVYAFFLASFGSYSLTLIFGLLNNFSLPIQLKSTDNYKQVFLFNIGDGTRFMSKLLGISIAVVFGIVIIYKLLMMTFYIQILYMPVFLLLVFYSIYRLSKIMIKNSKDPATSGAFYRNFHTYFGLYLAIPVFTFILSLSFISEYSFSHINLLTIFVLCSSLCLSMFFLSKRGENLEAGILSQLLQVFSIKVGAWNFSLIMGPFLYFYSNATVKLGMSASILMDSSSRSPAQIDTPYNIGINIFAIFMLSILVRLYRYKKWGIPQYRE